MAGLLALIATRSPPRESLFDGLAVENRAAVRRCAGPKDQASHIDDWIADMNQDGVSPTKVIEAVGVLRRVLDRAVRDKAIAQNSCTMRSGSPPKRPQTERPVLSPAEVEALACAMTHERDRVLVRLLARGGLRVGRPWPRWSDVDLPVECSRSARAWRIRQGL